MALTRPDAHVSIIARRQDLLGQTLAELEGDLFTRGQRESSLSSDFVECGLDKKSKLVYYMPRFCEH